MPEGPTPVASVGGPGGRRGQSTTRLAVSNSDQTLLAGHRQSARGLQSLNPSRWGQIPPPSPPNY
jgi:hypothetical protein